MFFFWKGGGGGEGVVDCYSIELSSLKRLVPRSTTSGAVHQRSNLLELMDSSTSSRVATDYH